MLFPTKKLFCGVVVHKDNILFCSIHRVCDVSTTLNMTRVKYSKCQEHKAKFEISPCAPQKGCFVGHNILIGMKEPFQSVFYALCHFELVEKSQIKLVYNKVQHPPPNSRQIFCLLRKRRINVNLFIQHEKSEMFRLRYTSLNMT